MEVFDYDEWMREMDAEFRREERRSFFARMNGTFPINLSEACDKCSSLVWAVAGFTTGFQ